MGTILSEPGSIEAVERNIHFRVILPVVSIALGVFLFYLGDVQVKETVVAQGGAGEGMPDVAASGRYVHYALNAPAWAVTGETRDMRWSEATYSSDHELRYFLVVAVLWYIVGLRFDRRRGTESLTREVVWYRPAGWGLILLAVLVGYVATSGWLLSGSKWEEILLARVYGWWFPLACLAWAIILLIAGVRMLRAGRTAITGRPSSD